MPKNKNKQKKKSGFSKISKFGYSSKLKNTAELIMAKSRFSNVFIRSVRRKKTGNSNFKSGSKKNYTAGISQILSSFFAFRKKLFKRLFLVLIIGGLVFAGVLFLRQYNSIKLTPYLEDSSEQNTQLNYFGPEYNVLVAGFQKISTNHFAQIILLVSLNSKSGNIKILSINPNFITASTISNKKYTLKSLINNVGSNDPMYEYTKSAENLFGVRIDRYVAFDVEQFKTFLTDWNLSMKSIDGFNATTGFFNKDNVLSKNTLAEYLFTLDSKENYDTLAARQLAFFNQFIQNNRSITFYLKAFWASDNLSSIFHTNMTKEEMSGFLSALMNSNLPPKTTVIDSTLGVASNTGTEDGLSPNYLEFDARIKDTVLSIDIIKEQASIEIYNASTVSGLANRVKRIFQNIGGNIINTNNYPEKVEGIKLYVPNKNPEKFVNNISAIQYYFGDKLKVIIGDYKYNYTGDLILVLGEN